MKTSLLILLASVAMFLTSCKLDEPFEREFSHYYTETSCANPWTLDSNNFINHSRIVSYLASQSIVVRDIRTLPAPEGFTTCQACTCASGRVIEVLVSPADAQKLENLSVTAHQQWRAY